MAKQKNPKKFATAQGRLKRIEKLIDPYYEDTSPQGDRPRAEWIPGDHMHGIQTENVLDRTRKGGYTPAHEQASTREEKTNSHVARRG